MSIPCTPAVAISCVASLCLVTSCTSAVDKTGATRPIHPVVLTMVNPGPGPELQPFVAAVDHLSKGALRIKLRNQWHATQPDGEAELIRYVQAGGAQLGLAPVRTWNGVGVRAFDALIAPFAVDSLALERRVLSNDLIDTMLRGTAPVGLTGIGVLAGPMRRPVGITHNFLGPTDYQGSTLAISASVVATRTFAALHASTVPSLFNGRPIDAFDGMELQIGGVEGNRYDRAASSITANVNLWPRPTVIFANAKSYAALTDRQRTVLRAAAKAATAATLQSDNETESLGNLCRENSIRFVTATPTQLKDLRRATQPVLAWLRTDPQTRQALDRIDSLRAEVTAADEVEAPPSCSGVSAATPGTSAPTGHDTPLDGVYLMTTTRGDVVAAGSPASDTPPESYGRTVFVVDRGFFAFTRENGRSCTWGYGTWVATGKIVEWQFTDGGGVTLSGALNKPGEHFGFGWSLYRDTLRLTHAPGELSPEDFLAKPWQRVSRTPSRNKLSHRCPPPAEALPVP